MDETLTPRTHRRLGLAVAGVIFLVDQLSKWYVLGPLDLIARHQVEMTPFFNFTFVANHGVSGGYLVADTALERWLLTGLTAAIAIGVTVWLWRERLRPDAIVLGLVLGGALGNILDRVRFGHVVDFLDLHFGGWQPFLVFNVADAAITIGVALLLLRALFTRAPKEPVEDVHA